MLERIVALKFLPLDVALDNELRKRFLNEARTASALNHPNICTIHAVEDSKEEPFIGMEFVEGQELKGIVGVPLVGVQERADTRSAPTLDRIYRLCHPDRRRLAGRP